MNRQILILLLVIFFLPLSAFAISMPISISDELQGVGIHIEPSTREYLKQSTNYTFSAHLFGLAFHQVESPDAVTCYLHYYDVNGSHLIQEAMTLNPNGVDFEKRLNEFNTSRLGEHDWIIYCTGNFYDANQTLITLNGFTRGRFIITQSGYDNNKLPPMSIAIISGLFFITLLFALGTWYFDNELKLLFLLLTSLSIVFNVSVIANLSADIASPQVVSLLWVFYKIMLYLFFFIFLWVLYKLFASLKASNKTAVGTDNDSLMKKLPK